ncbi:DUF6090 family protein [Gaetbulibacter aquiaggeris]|uniref:DUF6090 family protein n=1 Tax=Gaetbulibacter aquiaggeris TaxID=1735373 RepID=A0ABW7MTS8_9FLAO
MIPFFRKIRKTLADDNKPLKYLRYAIGEIVLVVIGILIALSINNWNEDRKLQNEELKLLFDIKTNLESNLANFKRDTIRNHEDLYNYQKIETYIKNNLPYNEELDTSFGRLTFWASPYIINTAYSSLQTKGLDLISNEVLKNAIVNMYEIELAKIIQDYDTSESELMSNIVTPFFAKHMKRFHEENLMLSRPNDFEGLKQNEEFKNILSMILRQRKRGFEFFRDIMISMDNLINEIDKELQSRQ